MNILLIEDNEAIILGVQYLLEQEGFRVLTAQNAAQGMKYFQEETCHLILLDVCLPDGNGFELCRKFRESSGVPVIFLTAREEEVDVVRGLELEADDYVIKPFRNRELVSRIRNVLRRSGQAQTVLRCGDISLDTVTGKIPLCCRWGRECQRDMCWDRATLMFTMRKSCGRGRRRPTK